MCQLILELSEEDDFHHQIVPHILFNFETSCPVISEMHSSTYFVQTPEHCMYFSSKARLYVSHLTKYFFAFSRLHEQSQNT